MNHSHGVVIGKQRPTGNKDSAKQQLRASRPIQLKILLQAPLLSRQHVTILVKMLDSPLEYHPFQSNSLNGALIKEL